jgi:hypothetical protein
MRRAAIWSAVVVVALVVMALTVIGRGISAAGHRPWPLEGRVARAGWRLLIPSHVRNAVNAVPTTANELQRPVILGRSLRDVP